MKLQAGDKVSTIIANLEHFVKDWADGLNGNSGTVVRQHDEPDHFADRGTTRYLVRLDRPIHSRHAGRLDIDEIWLSDIDLSKRG